MKISSKNNNITYEIPEEQYQKLEIAIGNIDAILDIMNDFCEHNLKKPKVELIYTLVEYLKTECKKILSIL